MEIYQLIYLQRGLGLVAKRMPCITELEWKKTIQIRTKTKQAPTSHSKIFDAI